jgi:hypothetical protein
VQDFGATLRPAAFGYGDPLDQVVKRLAQLARKLVLTMHVKPRAFEILPHDGEISLHCLSLMPPPPSF